MDPCTNNELTHLSSVCTCFTDVAYWQFAHVLQRTPRDKSQLQIPNRGQRQYHSFTGHSPIFPHEQLKLARAARGLPEITVLLKGHSLLSGTICLFKVRLVVTNPAVRRGTIHISILDPKQPVINRRLQIILLHQQNLRGYLELFFQRPRWMGPLHPLRRRRCKFAAFPKRTIFFYFFLRHFWVRCCGRVAQSGLHSASGKNNPMPPMPIFPRYLPYLPPPSPPGESPELLAKINASGEQRLWTQLSEKQQPPGAQRRISARNRNI